MGAVTDYAEKHGYYRENGYFQEDFAVRGEEKTVRVKSEHEEGESWEDYS